MFLLSLPLKLQHMEQSKQNIYYLPTKPEKAAVSMVRWRNGQTLILFALLILQLCQIAHYLLHRNQNEFCTLLESEAILTAGGDSDPINEVWSGDGKPADGDSNHHELKKDILKQQDFYDDESNQVGSNPSREYKLEVIRGKDSNPGPTVYVVTATYRRMTQKADLTRLAQTLMNLDFVFWIVVEDAEKTSPSTAALLQETNIPHHYTAASTPENVRNRPMLGRGVFNRRAAIDWLRERGSEGVLYFADDDNTYHIDIFRQMQYTRGVSVFPVGMILQYGVSSPVVRGGKVIAFHDAFQAGREFAVDMAGFAVNMALVHQHPDITIPLQVSYLEDGFLKGLGVTKEDLEPLADDCTKVLVWHTRTQAPATPNVANIEAQYSADTNLKRLYEDMLL